MCTRSANYSKYRLAMLARGPANVGIIGVGLVKEILERTTNLKHGCQCLSLGRHPNKEHTVCPSEIRR